MSCLLEVIRALHILPIRPLAQDRSLAMQQEPSAASYDSNIGRAVVGKVQISRSPIDRSLHPSLSAACARYACVDLHLTCSQCGSAQVDGARSLKQPRSNRRWQSFLGSPRDSHSVGCEAIPQLGDRAEVAIPGSYPQEDSCRQPCLREYSRIQAFTGNRR